MKLKMISAMVITTSILLSGVAVASYNGGGHGNGHGNGHNKDEQCCDCSTPEALGVAAAAAIEGIARQPEARGTIIEHLLLAGTLMHFESCFCRGTPVAQCVKQADKIKVILEDRLNGGTPPVVVDQ